MWVLLLDVSWLSWLCGTSADNSFVSKHLHTLWEVRRKWEDESYSFISSWLKEIFFSDIWSSYDVIKFGGCKTILFLSTAKWVYFICNKKQYTIAQKDHFMSSLSPLAVWFRLHLDIHFWSSCLLWHCYLLNTQCLHRSCLLVTGNAEEHAEFCKHWKFCLYFSILCYSSFLHG